MRAVLDTNVLVSTVLSSGTPYRIYASWPDGSFELIISPALMAELHEVLPRPHIRQHGRFSKSRADELIAAIQDTADWVYPQQQIIRITADPDDNRVLEAAVEGRADYIVTGDRHLLDLGEHEGIRIVTPARFLDILTAEGQNP